MVPALAQDAGHSASMVNENDDMLCVVPLFVYFERIHRALCFTLSHIRQGKAARRGEPPGQR